MKPLKSSNPTREIPSKGSNLFDYHFPPELDSGLPVARLLPLFAPTVDADPPKARSLLPSFLRRGLHTHLSLHPSTKRSLALSTRGHTLATLLAGTRPSERETLALFIERVS